MKYSFILLFVIAVFSCQNENEDQLLSNELLTIKTYQKVGDFHNFYLTHIYDSFSEPELILSEADVLTYINKDIENVAYQFGDQEIITKVANGLSQNTNFVFDSELRKAAELSIDNGIKELYDNKLIDLFEMEALLSLAQMKTEDMSLREVTKLISTISTDFESQQYSVNSENGHVLAIVLSISNSSMEWWNANPNAGYSEGLAHSRVLPAWLIADGVGAVVGGVASYYYQKSQGGCTSDNPCDIGGGIIIGGISGSTGAVGKVSKWIARLIK